MQQNFLFRIFVVASSTIVIFVFLACSATRTPSSNVLSKVGKTQGRDPKRLAVWKKISNKLCPSLSPQTTKYARHLFHLAQIEILQGNASQVTPTNCAAPRRNPKAKSGHEFAFLFFEHPDSWETFSYLDPGRRQFFSFLSIWKCANTQLRMYEKEIFNDTSVSFSARHKSTTRYKIQKHHDANKKNKKKKKTTHMKRLSDCVVAVIRDPISHFLSGYNEIEFRINVELKDQRESIAKKWPFGNQPPGSTQRFEQFVTDLVTCPIIGKQLPGIVEKYPNILELAHVYSMSAILRLLDQDPHISRSHKNFHYLPSLSNLNDETWAPFVLASCPSAFSEDTKATFLKTEMRTERWHESSHDPLGTYKAAKMTMKHEGPVAKALCALHLMDYSCWQNLPDGVPKVCMDLYLDYYRRDLLL